MKQEVKDLNLLLLYLSGWEEESKKTPGQKVIRAWNGYLFDVLNKLEEEEMIQQFFNGKSVILTSKGRARAEELQKKFI